MPAADSAEVGEAAVDAAAEAAAAAATAAEEASLPKVQLSSALLYQLLKTEFEIRNGNWQAAYGGLMALARKTRDPRLAARATELAMRTRAHKEAMVSVKLWRELAPASEEAGHYHMGLAMMLGDFSEAERVFARRLREASPQARGVAMFQVQQVLARAPDKAAASAALERLLAPYGEAFEARVLLAQNAFARGDAALAARHAERALALKPDSEVAVLTLAQVTPDPAATRSVLASFLAANPAAREVRLAYARVLLASKEYAAARKEFDALLAQQPDHSGAAYGMGLASVYLDDKLAAEKYFTRYAGLAEQGDDERNLGKVQLLLSQLAAERGDVAAALAWLEKISDSDADVYLSAQLQRAALQARQGDVDGARTRLATLMPEQDAERVRVMLAEAQILRNAGQLQQAYEVLEQGARRFPASPELLYDFALLAEKTGRLDVMETALRTVMRHAPDHYDAYNALGYSLAERNVRLDEALALIAKALHMSPDNPYILDSMGWVHFRLGNLAEAETHLRRAYALRSDPDVAVHLGEVLWRQGQKAAAQQLWREARARDPKNDTLRSTLSRLQLSL